MMLSKSLAEYLSSRFYRLDAKRGSCILPLCSIYWDDELPGMHHLLRMSSEDRTSLFRLFDIRLRLSSGEAINSDDQGFWDEARKQAPKYALFHRVVWSSDDFLAQEELLRSVEKELEGISGDDKNEG